MGAILLAAPDRDVSELAGEIARLAPEIEVRVWPDTGPVTDIEFAVVWKHPPELLASLPALRAVSSLGAGADHLLDDPGLPENLPVGRLAGPRLAADMAAYLVSEVVRDWKQLDDYADDQRRKRWQPRTPGPPPRIGLLGLGTMGQCAARAFQALELPVAAVTRSGRGRPGIETCGSTGELAERVDYLICLLPLTESTRGLIDADLLGRMAPTATLINVGRGEHLVEADLLRALDDGRPGGAILDVFEREPLPIDHAFWNHPRIRITPHCAAITQTAEAAALIVESYHSVRNSGRPLGLVDRAAGY